MAGPGGDEVARVSARVVPDTSDFDSKLRAELQKHAQSLEVRVPVRFDIDRAQLRAELEALRLPPIHVPVDVDLPKPPPEVPVGADTDAAQREVREFVAETEARRPTVHVQTELDRDRLQQFLDNANLKAKVEADHAALLSSFKKALTASNNVHKVKIEVEADRNRFQQSISALASFASTALSSAGSAIGAVRESLLGAADSASKFTSNISGALGPLASFIGTALQILTIGTGIALAGAAVTAAWATAATAVSALPAVLTLAGVAAGAVMLGLDGIKKAARTLKPEFDQLKAAVSSAFEKGLTPAFEKLRGLMPTIRTGMVSVADSISGVAQRVAELVTNSENARRIEQIFKNVSAAITGMTPGIKDAAEAMLIMASNGAAMGVLSGFVNELGAAWKNAVQELSDTGTLTAAFEGLQELLRAVARGFADLMKNGVEAFDAMAPGLTKFVDGLTGFFAKFDWQRIGTAVGNVFGGIGDAIKNIPQGTIDDLTRAFEELGQAFQDPAVQQTIQDIVALLPTAVREVTAFVKGFSGAFQSIKEEAQLWGDALRDTFGTGPAEWGQTLKEELANIGEFFSGLWDGIKTGASAVWEFLKTAATTAATGISTAWQGVKDFFAGIWQGIQTAASTVWGWITSAASTAATAISTGWTAIGTFFTTLWTTIQTAATTVWTWIQTAATTAATMITTAWTTLSTFFTTLWTMIQTAATTVWTWIQTAAITAATAVQTAWTAVTTFFAGLWTGIQAGVTAAWTAITTVISTAWTNIQTAVSTAISTVQSVLQGAWSAIQSAVQTAWQTVTQLVQTAWQNIVTAVQTGINNVLNFVRALPGQITSALGNLGSLLVEAGRALMEGLLNGIKAAWEAVASYLSGLAAKIRSLKGPKRKDQKLLIPAGNWIMGGLLDGLKDGAGDVFDWLRQFTRDLAGTEIGTPNIDDSFLRDINDLNARITASAVPLPAVASQALGAAQQIITNIYNPQPEKGSDSVARRVRTLAALGAFG